MGDLKSVILATDNTEYSEGAIQEAIFIAKNCGAKLSVIQVLQVNPEFATDGLEHVEEMELQCRIHFDHIRDLSAQENVEIASVCRRTDKPHEVIIEEAVNRDADVIVMGRRGWTGFKRFLLGSVTSKVIALSPCKVLVVPTGAAIKSEIIMLATDGSIYSEAAEVEVLSMARRCSHLQKIIVLSVATNNEKLSIAKKNIEKVEKEAFKHGIVIESITAVGKPHEIILQKAKEKNCDLIILGTHGRRGMKKLVLGSVSEKVVTHSLCAVLIAKN